MGGRLKRLHGASRILKSCQESTIEPATEMVTIVNGAIFDQDGNTWEETPPPKNIYLTTPKRSNGILRYREPGEYMQTIFPDVPDESPSTKSKTVHFTPEEPSRIRFYHSPQLKRIKLRQTRHNHVVRNEMSEDGCIFTDVNNSDPHTKRSRAYRRLLSRAYSSRISLPRIDIVGLLNKKTNVKPGSQLNLPESDSLTTTNSEELDNDKADELKKDEALAAELSSSDSEDDTCPVEPLCPDLIGCLDSIDLIIPQLTPPSCRSLLKNDFASNGIQTIGQLSALMPVNLNQLQFLITTPREETTVEALKGYREKTMKDVPILNKNHSPSSTGPPEKKRKIVEASPEFRRKLEMPLKTPPQSPATEPEVRLDIRIPIIKLNQKFIVRSPQNSSTESASTKDKDNEKSKRLMEKIRKNNCRMVRISPAKNRAKGKPRRKKETATRTRSKVTHAAGQAAKLQGQYSNLHQQTKSINSTQGKPVVTVVTSTVSIEDQTPEPEPDIKTDEPIIPENEASEISRVILVKDKPETSATLSPPTSTDKHVDIPVSVSVPQTFPDESQLLLVPGHPISVKIDDDGLNGISKSSSNGTRSQGLNGIKPSTDNSKANSNLSEDEASSDSKIDFCLEKPSSPALLPPKHPDEITSPESDWPNQPSLLHPQLLLSIFNFLVRDSPETTNFIRSLLSVRPVSDKFLLALLSEPDVGERSFQLADKHGLDISQMFRAPKEEIQDTAEVNLNYHPRSQSGDHRLVSTGSLSCSTMSFTPDNSCDTANCQSSDKEEKFRGQVYNTASFCLSQLSYKDRIQLAKDFCSGIE